VPVSSVGVMSVSDAPRTDPFGSVLAGVRDLCAQLVDQPTWSIPDGQLPELVRQADAAAAAIAELGCRLVAEADRRGIPDTAGATCTAGWIDQVTVCGRREAGVLTRTAKGLTGRYDLVRIALAGGQISLAKATVICTALDRLPAGLSADLLAEVQRSLLEQAQLLDPRRLAIVGRRVWQLIDPDSVDAHEAKLLEREEAKAARTTWLTSRISEQVMNIHLTTPPAGRPVVPDHPRSAQRPPAQRRRRTRPAALPGPAGRSVHRTDLPAQPRPAARPRRHPRHPAHHHRRRQTPHRAGCGGAPDRGHHLRRHRPPAGLHRPPHPHRPERGGRAAGPGPSPAALFTRAADRAGGPRRRLRVPRLLQATLLVRNTPHHSLVSRRPHRSGYRLPTLRPPPPTHPPRRLGGDDRRRPAPHHHPTPLDRPRPETPAQQLLQTQTPALKTGTPCTPTPGTLNAPWGLDVLPVSEAVSQRHERPKAAGRPTRDGSLDSLVPTRAGDDGTGKP
jgi:Domain of unknown function (DUF222)